MAEIYEHGQVVIPKYIREMFGLKPGAQVQFVVENNEIKLKPQDRVLEEFRALCAQADLTDVEVERSIIQTRDKRQKEWLNVP
jgi:AbrB family looped-hinge helix DNA binding protein